MENEIYYWGKRRRRAKLIFNPASGSANASPVQLMDIISMMQEWKFIPEVYLTEPDSDYTKMVQETLAQGVSLFVVCGGDGTVSAVAREISGLPATLGIIPTGTQNNIALSLNIPQDIASAISVFRLGERVKIDMGLAVYDQVKIPFLEVCSVGLMSSLFSAGDDIQHGHFERIGDFLATLVASSPSKIKLSMDDRREIVRMGHVVLVTNMPHVGRNYRVGNKAAFKDGLLDVLLFSNLNKMNLLGRALKGADISEAEDTGVEHYHVHKVDIETTPTMQVMVDSNTLGAGTVHIEMNRRALAVMLPRPKKEAGRAREAKEK